MSPTNERPFQCNVCPLNFTHRHCLTKHLKKVHKVADYSCPYCEKQFNAQRTLHQHIAAKCEDLSFPCEKCPAVFDSGSKLFHHLRRSHPIQCTNCPKTFGSQKSLKKHSFCNLPFQCQLCDQRFPDYRALASHHGAKHSNTTTFKGDDGTFKECDPLRQHIKNEHEQHPAEIDDGYVTQENELITTNAEVSSSTLLYDNLSFDEFLAVLEGGKQERQLPPADPHPTTSLVTLVYQETTLLSEEPLANTVPISEPERRGTLLLENISYPQLLSVLRNPAVLMETSPD